MRRKMFTICLVIALVIAMPPITVFAEYGPGRPDRMHGGAAYGIIFAQNGNVYIDLEASSVVYADESVTSVDLTQAECDILHIEHNAFGLCDNLTVVTLPSTLCSIGAYSFYGTALQDVYYDGMKSDWEKIVIEDGNDALFSAKIHFAVSPLSTDSSGLACSGLLSAPKRSKAEIAQLLNRTRADWSESAFDSIPSAISPYRAGEVKDGLLTAALNRFNALRTLAGLSEVTLDMDRCTQAQYGAVLQNIAGMPTHTPGRPADMDDSFYRIAATAATNNLHYAGEGNANTLIRAQDALMEDLGESNLSTVGHRRKMLVPNLGKVGFGICCPGDGRTGPTYVVQEVSDRSGTIGDYDFISWPASGNAPTELFSANAAWSITLNPDKFAAPNLSDISVTLTHLSDGKRWMFSGDGTATSEQKYYTINYTNYGDSATIVFRPNNIAQYYGIYEVSVSGLKYATGADAPVLRYQVDFFDTANYLWPVFNDVPNNAYYTTAVRWAYENGITNGTDSSHFSPSATVTRGQAVTFLWRAMGKPTAKAASNPFSDVKTSDYFYDAVLWAASEGITNGTDTMHFSPNDTLTCGQMITLLWRTAGQPEETGAGAWYEDAERWALHSKLTEGTAYTTNAACPRSDVVTYLYRHRNAS